MNNLSLTTDNIHSTFDTILQDLKNLSTYSISDDDFDFAYKRYVKKPSDVTVNFHHVVTIRLDEHGMQNGFKLYYNDYSQLIRCTYYCDGEEIALSPQDAELVRKAYGAEYISIC